MRVHRTVLLGMIILMFLVYSPLRAEALTADLFMDVEELYQKTATFSVGRRHNWYIRTTLPEEMEDISSVTILQTLSPALTLDPQTVRLRLIEENGVQTLLRMEDHYTFVAGSVLVDEGTADRICVTLTEEGMALLKQKSELIVSYTAKINPDAQVGSQILGTAQLNLTDSAGRKQIFLSDKASVSTGGICFQFSNMEGRAIEGASFMLARPISKEELEDSAGEKELLDVQNEMIAVEYERCYSTKDMDGELTDILVTDERGEAVCYGLEYGTYYLVQTGQDQTSGTYTAPVEISIDEASHLTAEDGWRDKNGKIVDHTVRITGYSVLIPQTGGSGTTAYTASGMIVILCAVLLLWYNRKRESKV